MAKTENGSLCEKQANLREVLVGQEATNDFESFCRKRQNPSLVNWMFRLPERMEEDSQIGSIDLLAVNASYRATQASQTEEYDLCEIHRIK